MRACLAVLVVAALGAIIASAQGLSTARQTFEAASVKPNVSGQVGGRIQVPPACALSLPM